MFDCVFISMVNQAEKTGRRFLESYRVYTNVEKFFISFISWGYYDTESQLHAVDERIIPVKMPLLQLVGISSFINVNFYIFG